MPAIIYELLFGIIILPVQSKTFMYKVSYPPWLAMHCDGQICDQSEMNFVSFAQSDCKYGTAACGSRTGGRGLDAVGRDHAEAVYVFIRLPI